MKCVSFGTYHSYDDFSLILASKEIAAPKTKTLKIDVEGADGSIDLTEFFGDPKYEDCTHKFQFSTIVPQSEFLTLFSTIKTRYMVKNCGLSLIYVCARLRHGKEKKNENLEQAVRHHEVGGHHRAARRGDAVCRPVRCVGVSVL